jgi:hypothetical protein
MNHKFLMHVQYSWQAMWNNMRKTLRNSMHSHECFLLIQLPPQTCAISGTGLMMSHKNSFKLDGKDAEGVSTKEGL